MLAPMANPGPDDDPAGRAAALRAAIADHDRRYHELDAPVIADVDNDGNAEIVTSFQRILLNLLQFQTNVSLGPCCVCPSPI